MDEQKKEGEKTCCTDQHSCCKCCCGCKVAIAIILFLLGGIIGYVKGSNHCKGRGCFLNMGASMPMPSMPGQAMTPPSPRGK
jgi:hypothetical protein